jgi:hypothetical protein
LGNPFAGQYAGTVTSATQDIAATAYIDVSGGVQLSTFAVADGTIDAGGGYSGTYPYYHCRLPFVTRTSTPFGEPFLLAGRALTGTIIDSTFRVTAGLPLESTTRWTALLTR